MINLTAMPVNKRIGEEDTLYALVFAEAAQRGEMPDAVPYEIDRVASQRITDLEQDLGEIQDKLNRSVAEQECVNEELQAANEELLTANEELQSSNEELQSVNEELYTVNSEYQQKLAELADLNDDIANFLSSTLIGIIFVDNKLNIRRYTDYVTTEFSVMDHDIGRSLKFISYHFPTVDISEICDNVLKTLVPDEREITTGKKKVFFMRVAPYRSTENKILGCVITLVDVTTQKLGLVKLQDTEKQLNIIQQENEAKSDYLSRIAHEIREPMASLIGLAKQSKQVIDDRDALVVNMEKMTDTLGYMASIVTEISEAAKNERILEDQIYEPFSLQDILNNVTSICGERAKDAGLSFEITTADGFYPRYIGNRNQVQQILINFLNNAIKYTPRGGSVSLKAFEAAGTNSKAAVCFVVSDTGVGIGEEFLPQLFKPYTRERWDDANEKKSMGLGLSIAYSLIKAMSGDVQVKSEVGKGTVFTIQVMLDRDESAVEHTGDMSVAKVLESRHALIVDDNAINLKILGSMLSSAGMTYTEACDGDVAVKTFVDAPEHTFDCILMDMRMPKLDGIKATVLIRDSGKADASRIPIIGVSANGFADDIKQAHNAGLDSYISKPIDKDQMLTILADLIRNKGK